MNTVTALLVVMTLAGSPVSSAVCAIACGHGTTPSAHCHEYMAGPAADVTIAADIACGALLPDVPYVKESVTLTPAIITSTSLVCVPRPVRLGTHVPRPSAAGAWLRASLVLRL